jgi:hypothetical protein
MVMTVAEIAKCTGASPRRIRYVLDHDLVPGTDVASHGRGSARAFPMTEAYAIALAVRLFDGGMQRSFIKGFVRGILEHSRLLEGALAEPREPDWAMVFELGDGENVRMRRGRDGVLDDPRWVRLATGRELAPSYRPGVVVAVDLADVLRRLPR